MTKEKRIKIENTFSVLQEEDTEALQEEKEPLQIVKIDKKYMKEREEGE